MNDIRELDEAELEAVSGGMDCGTAQQIAKTYRTHATIMTVLGMDGSEFLGVSYGLQMGAGCW